MPAVDTRTVEQDLVAPGRHREVQEAAGLYPLGHLAHGFEVTIGVERIAVLPKAVVFERRNGETDVEDRPRALPFVDRHDAQPIGRWTIRL
jgi:hypothetical protein